MDDRLARQLAFILELDKLKRVLRCSLITGASRRENSAEHSWHLALAALVLAEHANEPVDAAHAAKLALVHDIVEIDAGDVNVYDTAARAAQSAAELAAAERLFGLLPPDQADQLRALWDEFERGETPEARFARALDRLLPVMLNYHTQGQAWRERGATAEQVCAVNSRVAEGSEALWEHVSGLIAEATARGWLVADTGSAKLQPGATGSAKLQLGSSAVPAEGSILGARLRARLEPGAPSGARLEPGAPSGTAERWHSRGYMPHFESGHVVQHVTFRLADSLPADVLRRLEEEAQSLAPEQRAAGLHRRLEAWVDAGHGCCVLRRPEAAELVQAALLHFDAERYRLLAWAIMPNHVHVLLQTCGDWTLAATVKSWKSFTGRRLVPLLPAGGTRQVWYREYWDRYIRDARHLAAAEAYIHQNPVRAGLVGSAEEWEWGSAKLELGAPSVARLVPGGHTQAKET